MVYIEDITRWREDMIFMFSWQEQYLTRPLRSLVRYYSCHSNIKFISSRHRVISSISFISRFVIFCSVIQTLLQYTHWPMVLTILYVNGHAEEEHLMSERRYHLVRNVHQPLKKIMYSRAQLVCERFKCKGRSLARATQA